MSLLPEDDPRLTHFVKQHRPIVPAADPTLEQRIMTLVEKMPRAISSQPSNWQRWRRRGMWLLPTSIAAGLVAISGSQLFLSPQPTETELAELETFIESTWQGTVAEQPTTETEELYPLVGEGAVN